MDHANHFDSFWKFEDNIERIHAKDVSCEEFIERFEKLNKPVVIEGMQVEDILMECFAIFNFFHFEFGIRRRIGRPMKNGRCRN